MAERIASLPEKPKSVLSGDEVHAVMFVMANPIVPNAVENMIAFIRGSKKPANDNSLLSKDSNN